jgi:hypothetical protein
MIGVAIIFFVLTVAIALGYGAWKASDKEARSLIVKSILKSALFASIAFVILFVIVNLF